MEQQIQRNAIYMADMLMLMVKVFPCLRWMLMSNCFHPIRLRCHAARFALTGVWTQQSFMALVGTLYQACLEGINTVPLNCAGDGLALYNLLFWCLLGNRDDQADQAELERVLRSCITCWVWASFPLHVVPCRATVQTNV